MILNKTYRTGFLFFAACVIFFLGGCGESGRGKNEKIAVFSDLNRPQYTIGSMTGIAALREAQTQLPKARFREYSMPMDAFTALYAGKIDAVVLDRPTLEYMALAHPGFSVMKQDLAVGHISVAAAKRSAALMNEVNSFIRCSRKDGTYRKMYDRWFRTAAPQMPEIAQPFSRHKALRVGVTANNEPMCFIQNGKLAGFDTEFALRLGAFLKRKIVFRDISYDALPAALESGKIDLAIAQMDAMPERMETLLFSENYIDSPITMMVLRRNMLTGTQDKSPLNSGKADLKTRISEILHSLQISFGRTFLREGRWKLILQGLGTTLFITVFSVLLGTMLAFPVCMICRSQNRVLAWFGERYVSLILGTPLLVILMILYYVIFAKVDLPAVLVAILAFALDFSANNSVTLRSGIDGIPRGQMEAALALGYRPMAAFCRFLLPQAVRTVLPVYRSEIINTLKATSIVGYIAILDLTKTGDIIRSRTYEAFFPLIAIAFLYFLAAKILTLLLLQVEKRLDPAYHRNILQKRGTK